MKRILATTALVALTAMPVFAQTDATDPAATDAEVTTTDTMEMTGPDLAPSDFIDRSLYASSAESAPGITVESIDAPADDWDDVGRIEDLILTPDGEIDAIIVDVGGFFDMGARQVSIPLSDLTIVDEIDGEGEFFVVYNGSSADLEGLPELDRTAVNDSGNSFHTAGNTAVGSDEGLTEDAVTEVPPSPETDDATTSDLAEDAGSDDAATTEAAPADTMAPTDDATTSDMAEDTGSDDAGMTEAAPADTMAPTDEEMADGTPVEGDEPYLMGDERSALTASDLQGINLTDMAGERIGTISEIVLTDDGQVGDVIIDVGGFLGIGAKSVAIAFEDIELTREEGAMSDTLQATTMITADQFETMEEWDG
ncbi:MULTISPECIES: PRC-barrel domain-containing protein [unclassified Yoonia]|uniref:PRC-barrel domain-containing protein n=1 Tax=unclassified Yoonia TaxID=2629118 RepID=UPI002AFEA965|nr:MULTISPECIES: PRC-barrel domain-containing protein [unclassified Yoonia]